MATQKIAITVPPDFLVRVDRWARKKGTSRSRFIVEELNHRLHILEDEEITELYNEVSTAPGTAAYDHELAEDLLSVSSIHEEQEKW